MNKAVMLLYCGGALLESLGEPMYNLYNQSFRVDCRLKADAGAILVRSIVTFVAVICYELETVGFGLAQLSYGLIHVSIMVWNYREVMFSSEGRLREYSLTLRDTLPSLPSSDGAMFSIVALFGAEATANSLHMTGTSLLKHCLTEADKIALSLSSSATHYDQGVYGVINNYGSLVARMIFQPVEETARIAFSKMAAKVKLHDKNDERESVMAEFSSMATLLSLILKTLGLFSLLFPVFGPCYSRVAVQFGLGSRWYSEETVHALAVYCFYIFVLGLNGVSEAFVYATAESGILNTVNASLLTSSLMFCVTAPYLLARMGTSGILIANILSMTIRIGFNIAYTSRYFSNPERAFPKSFGNCENDVMRLRPLHDAFVHKFDVIGMVVVSLVMYVSSCRYATSSLTLLDATQHVFVGALCFVGILVSMYRCHASDFSDMLKTMRESKNNDKEKDKTD